jgi:hypothetical protein
MAVTVWRSHMRGPDSVKIQWILTGLQLRPSRKQQVCPAPPAQTRRQGRCRADILNSGLGIA